MAAAVSQPGPPAPAGKGGAGPALPLPGGGNAAGRDGAHLRAGRHGGHGWERAPPALTGTGPGGKWRVPAP